ncbi:MAG: O-antigen ligase family protein, partial [Verrucomicrobiota bacterium]
MACLVVGWCRARPEAESDRPSLNRLPWIACLSVLFSLLISSGFSVAPRTGVWGSYDRLQGCFTGVAGLVTLAGVAVAFRTGMQRERLILVLIMASIPVSLYAVGQRFGFDPLVLSRDVSGRVLGTLGNPLFLSGYLMMIVPVTARQLMMTVGPRKTASTLVMGSVLLLQILAMVLTGSRGPVVGLIVGLVFFFLFHVGLASRKRLLLTASGLLVGAGLLAAALSSSGSESHPAGGGLDRLRLLFDIKQESSQVRIRIWEGVVDMLTSSEPLTDAAGKPDGAHRFRLLIGYGPDCFRVAYARFAPSELKELEVEDAVADHAHNEVWNVLCSTGILGVLAWFLLWFSLFHQVLRRLDLIVSKGRSRGYWLACLSGILAGGVGVMVLGSSLFLGVGVSMGAVIGLFGYALWAVAMKSGWTSSGRGDRTLDAALGAAMIAYFVEIQFGVNHVTSRFCFWVFAGLIIRPPQPVTEGEREEQPAGRSAMALGFLLTGLFSTMIYSFTGRFAGLTSPPSLLILSAAVLQFAVMLVTGRATVRTAFGAFLIAGMLVLLSGWIQETMTPLFALEAFSMDELARSMRLYEMSFYRYILLQLFLGLGLGLALRRNPSGRAPTPALLRLATVLALVGPGVWFLCLRPAIADMNVGIAGQLVQARMPAEATVLYRRAVVTAPRESRYRSRLARHLHTHEPSKARDEVFRLFEEASALAPYRTAPLVGLGRVHRSRASRQPSSPTRREQELNAEQAFEQALRINPRSHRIWMERGLLHLSVTGDRDRAFDSLRQALDLAPKYGAAHRLLGYYHTSAVRHTGDPAEQRKHVVAAIEHFE